MLLIPVYATSCTTTGPPIDFFLKLKLNGSAMDLGALCVALWPNMTIPGSGVELERPLG